MEHSSQGLTNIHQNPLPTRQGEGDLNTTERRTEQAQRRVQKNIKKDAKRTARELKKKEQLTRKSVCIDFPFPTGQMRCMKVASSCISNITFSNHRERAKETIVNPDDCLLRSLSTFLQINSLVKLLRLLVQHIFQHSQRKCQSLHGPKISLLNC